MNKNKQAFKEVVMVKQIRKPLIEDKPKKELKTADIKAYHKKKYQEKKDIIKDKAKKQYQKLKKGLELMNDIENGKLKIIKLTKNN